MIVVLSALSAPAAEPVASYDLDVRLDPVSHRLAGQETVRWVNSADTPTSELHLHLYLNAFASPRTTFMRELGGRGLRGGDPASREWGWIRILSMRTADGDDLLSAMGFVRPDDGNPDDFTVARVALDREVPPGEGIELEIGFEAQLPSIIARTGFAGDFHMVAQWFPKLGVFEGARGWNCHQFHAASEFFADFGRYRATVEVPEGWVVGATGVEVQRSTVEEGTSRRERILFQADRVHDFAWCAAPPELMLAVEGSFEPGRDVPQPWLEDASARLGRSAADLELPAMNLRLILPRSQAGLAPRMLRAIRAGAACLGLRYGPYPYPQLTVVSPPATAADAWGMEYPTLFTTGAVGLMRDPPLRWVPWIESVTVHEFAHQYFQGMLASNEFEQAWLDEGLATFSEDVCMEAMGSSGLFPWVDGLAWTNQRLDLARRVHPLRPDRPAWEFRSLGAYGDASYTQMSLTLRTLEGLLGPETLARALRAYVERFRFSHPTGADLQRTLEEVGGEPLGWFFDQAVYGDATPDWAVVRVSSRPSPSAAGLRWTGSDWEPPPAEEVEDAGPGRDVEIQVARLGDMVGPVVVQARYEDGSTERTTWDGRTRWLRWHPGGDREVVEVVVDPDGVWALETERADNYWRLRPAEPPRRPFWWTDGVLQLLATVVLSWS